MSLDLERMTMWISVNGNWIMLNENTFDSNHQLLSWFVSYFSIFRFLRFWSEVFEFKKKGEVKCAEVNNIYVSFNQTATERQCFRILKTQ